MCVCMLAVMISYYMHFLVPIVGSDRCTITWTPTLLGMH